MQAQSGHTIEDIYRGVINDVINQVREAFLDENVDIEVLQQLKKTWEAKVNDSGAVDLDGTSTKSLPPPTLRQPIPQNVPVQTRQGVTPAERMTPMPAPNISIAGPSHSIAQPGVSMPQPRPIISMAQHSTISLAGPSIAVARPNNSAGLGQVISIAPPGISLVGQNVISMAGSGLSMAGSGMSLAGPSIPMNMVNMGGDGRMSQADVKMLISKMAIPGKNIPQLDGGGGPGMTDSSSESEEEHDESLNRFARLGNDNADEEAPDDDDPLNSNDDQSDDEDVDKLFQAENVVVCQFEKVHRARNKWKFILKDGIMNLKGKDYCFQKGLGEAEW